MFVPADGNLAGRRLVIFGCGYVGSEVARQAIARGMHVTALTRNADTAAVLRECGVDTIVAELADNEWHRRIAGGADYVLSCVSSGGGGVDAYRRSYIGGNTSIAAWLRSAGPAGTLIYTSSTSVYPQGEGAIVDESSPTSAHNDRARVLLTAEDLVRCATESVDGRKAAERWFVLRLAGIYGPGRCHLIDQVRDGLVSGTGKPRLNLVHRDDVVAAIWAAFAAPKEVCSGVFNICDHDPTAKSDVVNWLVERTGWTQPRFGGISARGGGIAPDRLISSTKASRLLGWKPRFPSFREGYERLLSH